MYQSSVADIGEAQWLNVQLNLLLIYLFPALLHGCLDDPEFHDHTEECVPVSPEVLDTREVCRSGHLLAVRVLAEQQQQCHGAPRLETAEVCGHLLGVADLVHLVPLPDLYSSRGYHPSDIFTN